MVKRKSNKGKIDMGLVVLIIALALFVIYSLYTLGSQHKKINYLKGQKINLEKQISEKEEEIKTLKKEQNSTKTKAFVEKHARENLKMVKKGEIVYVDTNREQNIREE